MKLNEHKAVISDLYFWDLILYFCVPQRLNFG